MDELGEYDRYIFNRWNLSDFDNALFDLLFDEIDDH
jgi:hypothetical protein